MSDLKNFNIDAPLWDLRTFSGRLKHFFWVTDPRTCLVSDAELDKAKLLVEQYRKGIHPPDTTREQLIYAKKLYQGAFHPDSGEKQQLFGRISVMVPGSTIIIGGMLSFYRSVAGVIFWQWINQSRNAWVNYTNRNAQSPITNTQIAVAYVMATGAAMITAAVSKRYLQRTAPPFFQRYVPLAAVAAGHFVNIPLMRQKELINGIDVADDAGEKVCKTRVGATKGILQVIISRITMSAPGMIVLPIIMENLNKTRWFPKSTVPQALFQTFATGCILIVMVPTGCALFPQRCSINAFTIEAVEKPEYQKLQMAYGDNIPSRLYFNKGL